MIYVAKNALHTQNIYVTVDNYNYYVLRLVDSRGNTIVFNKQNQGYTKRYTRLQFTMQDLASLAKGEYKYIIYQASNSNDVSYENKEQLEVGIIKIV